MSVYHWRDDISKKNRQSEESSVGFGSNLQLLTPNLKAKAAQSALNAKSSGNALQGRKSAFKRRGR
jgi:hypothetical protein